MEKFQPVIDWFTDRGGKYAGDSSPTLYQDAVTKFWEEIEHSGNHEVQYRGLQLFVTEVSLGDEKSLISLQYLLDHGRQSSVHFSYGRFVQRTTRTFVPARSRCKHSAEKREWQPAFTWVTAPVSSANEPESEMNLAASSNSCS